MTIYSPIPENIEKRFSARFIGNDTWELPQTTQLLFYHRLLRLYKGSADITAYRLGSPALSYKYFVAVKL